MRYCKTCSKPDENGWIRNQVFYDGTNFQCGKCGRILDDE